MYNASLHPVSVMANMQKYTPLARSPRERTDSSSEDDETGSTPLYTPVSAGNSRAKSSFACEHEFFAGAAAEDEPVAADSVAAAVASPPAAAGSAPDRREPPRATPPAAASCRGISNLRCCGGQEGGAGGGRGGDLREVGKRRRLWPAGTEEEAPRRRWRRRRRATPGLEEELAEEGLEQGREPAAGRGRTGELHIFARFIQSYLNVTAAAHI
uniref:Uncharacterized protein n=1 Tax=Leersia perrieri TaxID=77586 RepID=A0A0D9W6S8_9ORYZ